MVVLLYRACTVFVKHLHTCVVCLSFGLVLHALQGLVTYLGSQSLFPNHCLNGVGIAKRLYSGLRFPCVLLWTRISRDSNQIQRIKAALHIAIHLSK